VKLHKQDAGHLRARQLEPTVQALAFFLEIGRSLRGIMWGGFSFLPSVLRGWRGVGSGMEQPVQKARGTETDRRHRISFSIDY